MSMEKAILSGKEHRKPYNGSKAIDRTCRNHGGCEWCKGNRMYSSLKKELKMKQEAYAYECGDTESGCHYVRKRLKRKGTA